MRMKKETYARSFLPFGSICQHWAGTYQNHLVLDGVSSLGLTEKQTQPGRKRFLWKFKETSSKQGKQMEICI